MIQSVQRAVALLNAVGMRRDWVGVRDLAREVGLKVTTAQTLLKTLAQCGYLEFDEKNRRYRVGLAVLQLAEYSDPMQRHREFVHPFLESVFQQTGETVVASMMVHGQVTLIDWLQARHRLAVVHFDSDAEHAHLLAIGKVLLAYQDEGEQRAYAAGQPLATLGPNTPTTANALIDELRHTREQGYGEVIDPSGNGIAAVAVPVWGVGPLPVFSLGSSIPLARYTHQRLDEIHACLAATADEMHARLGAVSPTTEEELP